VLCARIGSCPKDQLAAAGIRAVDEYAFEYIETAVAAVFRAEAAQAVTTKRTA
jgi:nitrogen fixation protein NifB